MIDIGANVGDSVAIVREQSDYPILCIEGNETYFQILEENLRRGAYASVMAVNVFVATYTGELIGRLCQHLVPVVYRKGAGLPSESFA
jgi:FkbM family methyltransferase